jgi:quinol-cytochrome oxidoreductase complex cytochrome b subunit
MINMAKSKHIITDRNKGSLDRYLVLAAVVLLIIFSLCSAYAVMLQPTNAATWSMAVFFIVPLVLLLMFEHNTLPDIDRKKILPASITWFFSWIFIAFFMSFVFTMEMAYLAMAILFGIIVVIGSMFCVSNERRWRRFKAKLTAGQSEEKQKKKSKKKPKKKSKKKRRFARF